MNSRRTSQPPPPCRSSSTEDPGARPPTHTSDTPLLAYATPVQRTDRRGLVLWAWAGVAWAAAAALALAAGAVGRLDGMPGAAWCILGIAFGLVAVLIAGLGFRLAWYARRLSPHHARALGVSFGDASRFWRVIAAMLMVPIAEQLWLGVGSLPLSLAAFVLAILVSSALYATATVLRPHYDAPSATH